MTADRGPPGVNRIPLWSRPLLVQLETLTLDVGPVECGPAVLRPAPDERVLIGDMVGTAEGSRVRDGGPPQSIVFGILGGAGTEDRMCPGRCGVVGELVAVVAVELGDGW